MSSEVNNAKMRETLEDILHGIEEKFAAAPTQVTSHEYAILHRCKAALAESPRNCEVGSVEEQYKRHCEWCVSTRDFSCHPRYCRKCFALWSQKPYEPKEGGNDGNK